MKLKRTIQFIEYSNFLAFIGLIIGVIAFTTGAKDHLFIILEWTLAAGFLLLFVFRKLIVTVCMKKSTYPGVFYSVLDKLKLTEKLEIHLSDELLDEIYNPRYSTHQFISDNNLQTAIGHKKQGLSFLILPVVAGVAIALLNKQPLTSGSTLFTYGLLLLSTLIGLYQWRRYRQQQPDHHPLVLFTEKGLILQDKELSWKDIYDWNYEPNSDKTSKVIVRHYDAGKNIREDFADLSKIDIGKIDFLLLMTHFKGKYGYRASEE